MKKKLIVLAAVLSVAASALTTNVGAYSTVMPQGRLMGADGWLDSFEDKSAYAPDTAPVSTDVNAMISNPDAKLPNHFKAAQDPLGTKHGQCLLFEYGTFLNSGAHNPYIQNGVSTGLIKNAKENAAVFSFDMYLPQNFINNGGKETTFMQFQFYPVWTGSGGSSDYQTWRLDHTGLAIPGLPKAQLPTGKWFNVKFVLYTAPLEDAGKADLFVDGTRITAGPTLLTGVSVKGGRTLQSTVSENGIASIRMIQNTGGENKTIENGFQVYIDNLEVRSIRDIEPVDVRMIDNGGSLTVEADLINIASEGAEPCMFTTVSKDGILLDIVANTVQIAAEKREITTIRTEVAAPEVEGCEVRTFVTYGLNDFNTILPMTYLD